MKKFKIITKLCVDCAGEGVQYGYDGEIRCETCWGLGMITPSNKKYNIQYSIINRNRHRDM